MCAHHEDDHAHEAQAALAVTPQASSDSPAGRPGESRQPGWLARAAIALVRGYQRYISAFTPPVCRFQPTCSQYTLVAIQRHGFLRGVGLGAWRILRCHPFHPGGFDPVPEAKPPRADRPPQGA